MQLQPYDTFTVVRQIANHIDTATYYVRAIIRNAKTDDIIVNLDLTDKGGQRFKKDWIVPNDATGMGFYISIVTSVYTDSGYTTKSDNYGDEENTYLIDQRKRSSGGGGDGVSIRDVRDVLTQEIAKIKFPEQKEYEMRWDEILSSLKEVRSDIKNIPQTDLSSVLSGIDRAINAIEEKPVTEIDLSPVLEKLNEESEGKEDTHGEMKDLLLTTENKILDEMPKIVSNVLKSTEFYSTSVSKIATKIGETKEKESDDEEDEMEDIDISKLV